MGLFGPSKAERAAAEAKEKQLEQERAEQKRIGDAEQQRFQTAIRQWLDSIGEYQLATHAPRLTDEVVTEKLIMPLPSTRGLSRTGAVYNLAAMRSYANATTQHYEVKAVVAKGEGAMSFWQDVRHYVEGALLQPGL